MIIKKGTKYYNVIEEVTSADFNKKKDNISKQYKDIDSLMNEKIEIIKTRFKEKKEKIKKELDELNAL